MDACESIQISGAVIGAAIEVHRALGPGFLESVYESAMAIEMARRGIRFERQHGTQVHYRGQLVGHGRADFLVEACLLVELKAVHEIAPIHRAQVMSYLKASRLRLGLLLNFNVRVISATGVVRVVLD